MVKDRSALSLFAGAGGLDIGLHAAGFRTKLAVEIEEDFCETLRANKWISQASQQEFDTWFDKLAPTLGRLDERDLKLMRERYSRGVGEDNAFTEAEILQADIRQVRSPDLLDLLGMDRGELDLVVGGPPCQSFSKSGKRRSLDDVRGRLFLEFVRIVDDLRPRWFIFENVKGLTNSSGYVVTASCERCGKFQPRFGETYVVGGQNGEDSPALTCVACGGTTREILRARTVRHGAYEIIRNEFEAIGYSCEAGVFDAADVGAPQYRERLFIVGSRDHETIVPLMRSHHPVGEGQMNLLGDEQSAHRTVWQALFSEPNPHHEWPLDPHEAVLWVKNVVRPHDEPVTWTLHRPSPTVGAHQSAKLAIAPKGVPEAQLARQQWHTKGRRQGDTPPVPVEHTYLSDEDLLVLQTFPPSWALVGTRMPRAFQIGNAVPPVLGQAVAERLGD